MAMADTKSSDEKKKIYDCMTNYVIRNDYLREYGYPIMDSIRRVTVENSDRKEPETLPNPNERFCYRCRTKFTINPDGTFTPSERCFYHLGGLYRKKHTCCQQGEGFLGCQTAESHVHRSNRYLDVEGYVETASKPGQRNDVYCVDCEMIYTSHGLELAQVTVVDTKLRTVLDELVKPSNPVVEWNTRFSGITEDMMSDVETTLPDIQTRLLQLFDDNTILVGHSPEFDHIALKLVHGKTVDTAIVFSETLANGTVRKRSLKDLVKEHLGRNIQDNKGREHDSKEDAVACMELMMNRVKQDMMPM